MSASATQGGHNKYQLSLMNPRDTLHHGERAASKGGRAQCDKLVTKLS